MQKAREAKAQATILEIVGDLPDAEMAPPENVLFVCKLNPVTTDADLEIIFSRFGKIKRCLKISYLHLVNGIKCKNEYLLSSLRFLVIEIKKCFLKRVQFTHFRIIFCSQFLIVFPGINPYHVKVCKSVVIYPSPYLAENKLKSTHKTLPSTVVLTFQLFIIICKKLPHLMYY